MKRRNRLVVGTRGSALALVQTEEVFKELRAAHPDLEFQVVTIRTSPDVRREDPLSSFDRGMFVKELEYALLDKKVDMVVHSLKDLPSETPPQFSIAAIGKRLDPRDVLVSRAGLPLARLPSGARIGTSSPRRACQVKALRRDVEIVLIRGNVDTRLRKVSEGQYDAAVVAAAGVARLGLLDQVSQFFSPREIIPPPGQGALAVETRAADEWAQWVVGPVNHQPTAVAVTAERAFMARLGAGCRVPFAAYGEVTAEGLKLVGLISDTDGERCFTTDIQGDPARAEELGVELAERLLSAGARDLVET
ncbi:MAG: hydroxymethylbilane synthase [Dehalococcoidia bacterium]|nr:hydroxymethylbilane synthase [Dehalococcoidia bacterium]